MRRTLLGIGCGAVVGIACAVGLLVATNAFLAWWTAPTRFAIEHQVIYLAVVLGAGFGALTGGLAAGGRNGS